MTSTFDRQQYFLEGLCKEELARALKNEKHKEFPIKQSQKEPNRWCTDPFYTEPQESLLRPVKLITSSHGDEWVPTSGDTKKVMWCYELSFRRAGKTHLSQDKLDEYANHKTSPMHFIPNRDIKDLDTIYTDSSLPMNLMEKVSHTNPDSIKENSKDVCKETYRGKSSWQSELTGRTVPRSKWIRWVPGTTGPYTNCWEVFATPVATVMTNPESMSSGGDRTGRSEPKGMTAPWHRSRNTDNKDVQAASPSYHPATQSTNETDIKYDYGNSSVGGGGRNGSHKSQGNVERTKGSSCPG